MILHLRTLTVFLGAFLALAIVLVQLFHFHIDRHGKKESRAEQHDKKQKGDESSYNVLTSFSLPSPAHLELNTESFCLFEISFEEEGDKKYSLDLPLYTSKILQHLFRVIISPNAP